MTGNPMVELLPNGTGNKNWKNYLDKLASVFKLVPNIPIIFRPFHENTGGWFWFGSTNCSPDEFKAAWNYTFKYLTEELNVHNLLFAYSPSKPYLNSDDAIKRYPGND
mmetsp:Transcript_118694/g.177423  ORF Transcript_118694/g.177423 Transcript_118694/m.177423 type:complete len:108 (-) Transcript_118694:368-691(-)